MSGRISTSLRSTTPRRKPLVAALAATAVLVVVVVAVTTGTSRSVPSRSGASAGEPGVSAAVGREFAVLSAADTDVCQDLGNEAAIQGYIEALADPSRLRGSCCSAMDLQRFSRQVEALEAYSTIPAIPPDPYDISKSQAEELLGFYDNIQLDQAQLSIYDAAQSLTSDHGWCCCECWAWYTHAGLAKYLITQYGFGAHQTAQVVDLEDCCGGAS